MIQIPTEIRSRFPIDNTQLLLLVVLTALAARAGIWYWQNRRIIKLASYIPDPKVVPFYGITLELLLSASEGTFSVITRYMSFNSDLFKFWFGKDLYIFPTRPEHFEAVLTDKKCLAKPSIYHFTKAYAGYGLFAAPLKLWEKHRKLMHPTFNQQILTNDFLPIFIEKGDILMEVLENSADDPDFDISEKLTAFTVDSICQTTIGVKVDAQISSNRFAKVMERFVELVTIRMVKLIYQSQIIFDLRYGKIFREYSEEMKSFTRKVYNEQKESFEQKMKSINEGSYVEIEESKRRPFLGHFLEIRHNGQISDQEVEDEVNTLIAAGTDTSAYTLGFCTLMLAMYPEYQQKMLEEVLEVLGPDRDFTPKDIPKLKFMDMFIKETLRIFPVIPVIARTASDEIKIGGFVIPEGTTLVLSIYNIQRNPEFWKDPLVFNPYRFRPEEYAKLHPFSYIPFSFGRRNCIGDKYADLVLKTVLTKMIRRFELKTKYKSIEEVNLKMSLFLRPIDGFKVSVHRRN